MRVLILMDNPMIPTGYASTCRLTARELIKRGHEVWAMAFNGGAQPPEIADWYGVKIIPNYSLTRDGANLYGDLECLKRAIGEVSPDVIFFHNDAYRYGYLKDIDDPSIFERGVFWLPFEGDHPDMLGVMLFRKLAATRFVTSHALEAHAGYLKDKDIGRIYHAVDTEALVPCPDKAAAKAANIAPRLKGALKGRDPSSVFVVCRVDRHQPRKYWDLTVKAFAEFARGKDDVFLLGKCDPRDCTMWEPAKGGVDLEKMADELGVADKSFFDNFFFDTASLAKSFYHPADVFLTTTSGEGFGLTPVEAMACGCPVIYPDTPVLPEVIGDAGWMCKREGRHWYDKLSVWHNVPDIADVVAKLDHAYADWKAGGKEIQAKRDAGLRLVAERYSSQRVYDEWDSVIRRVAERKSLVSMVTVLYNMTGEPQLTGEDGVDRLRATIEEHVNQPYEWIIVDNGSPARAETRAWMEGAAAANPRIRPIYLDANMGFAGGNNAAIAQARGKYVILINPDSEAINPSKHGLTKDFAQILRERAESDKSIGIIGMKLSSRDDILQGLTFPYFGCALITRPCLDACKISDGQWLDESFWPAYYEDSVFTIRAMGKGFKVVEQDIPFWHKSGGTNKHAIEGGKEGPHVQYLRADIDKLEKARPGMADWGRKRAELDSGGMQGLIRGNISQLESMYGRAARAGIKVVWNTHVGAAVGFSVIAEGMAKALHDLGFDVYVNDWSNGSKITDPVIRELYEKTIKTKDAVDLSGAINIVCWLMETFLDVDADYKVGISFCESTKVRESYLHACNSCDRILTFSEFCKGVQENSGYKPPIHVLPPGVPERYIRLVDRPERKKFTFLAVGVCQDRKDTRRLVEAFCEAFPKGAARPPECEDGFPLHCDDVELVVKSNNFGDLQWLEGYKSRGNVRGIFTGGDKRAERGDFSEDEMLDLYASADCLVHPSHGEGIGYPICEMAATGGPVIFTNWSSPAECFDESNSYPISLSPYPGTTLTPAYPGAPGDNGLWANCHIGHLKHLMYHVIRNRAEARERGRRAHEKVKSHYTFRRSASRMFPLLFEWDACRKSKTASSGLDLTTFKEPAIRPVVDGDRVMIDVVTRDRHPYLGVLLGSLLNQTFKNWDIIIQVDDADESVLNNHLIKSLLHRMHHEGHGWSMIRSHRQGPHMAHDRSLRMTAERPYKYKLMCRIDDDLVLRPDYLEKIYSMFMADKDCKLAAVGGVYPNPSRSDQEQAAPKGFEHDVNYAGKIDHNVPWPYVCLYPPGTKPRKVEHLYSSFMFRVELGMAIGGYCRTLSQIGHREESDFSCRFHFAGYEQYVHPGAVAFHFHAPGGGIRSGDIIDKQKLAEADHRTYLRRLARWKKQSKERREREAARTKEAEAAKIEANVPPAPIPASMPQPRPAKNKMVVVINGNGDVDSMEQAVGRFKQYGDVYVTCDSEATKERLSGNPAINMTASTPDETMTLAKALVAEGDHEFIMTVRDSTVLLGNPVPLLGDDYDDYVFETYTTYRPPHDADADEAFIGPEVSNECLIKRRGAGKDGRTPMERILFSDIMVLDKLNVDPVSGKSAYGLPLMPLSKIGKTSWTKICVYQYPEGDLAPPRKMDVACREQEIVSIIIPTAGRVALLRKCLDSIYSFTSTPFEIIIVDNASEDGTAEYLEAEAKKRRNITVLSQQVNLGYQKAINLGVAMARGRYVLLFNDDAWVESREPDGQDWLAVLADELDADPTLGLIGPHGGKSPALGTDMLYFWCVMLKRSTWDEVGKLDDVTFVNYGGDDDYCERLRRAGYEIRQQHVHLRHLMTCVPEEKKRPELMESEKKLRTKYLTSVAAFTTVDGSSEGLVAECHDPQG